MEDRSDVEQQPPARWASPALPSTARQQRDSWPESPGRYGPPHEQHYFATAPTRSQPIHHPPAHPYYPSPGPYSPARQSAPASMYRLPPPPSPPLPASLSSSAPPGSGTYYNSNPVPPPASYDWSAPLPPIRLAPPSHSPYHRDGSPSLHSPYLHSPSQLPAVLSSISGPASASGSSTRESERSVYGDSSRLGPSRSVEQWIPQDGDEGASIGEQEQFDSSVQALRSLAQHASEVAAKIEPSSLDEGTETEATVVAGKGKGKDVERKTYASSDSDVGETNSNGQKVKKRKRRRKATEEPRDAANRKFMCQTCKKLFARPSALATHERSHSKEKPHVCPFPTCRRPFAVPSNLRRHQRVYGHHDPELTPAAGPSGTATASESLDPSGSPNLESSAPVSPLPLPLPSPAPQRPHDGPSTAQAPVGLPWVQ